MPLPPIQPDPASDYGNANQQLQQNAARNERRNPSEAQWNTHKDNIYRLYITENLTLNATMRVMENDYGFIASFVHHLQTFLKPRDTLDELTLMIVRECIKSDFESGDLSRTSRNA
jgi:hypothetical protein